MRHVRQVAMPHMRTTGWDAQPRPRHFKGVATWIDPRSPPVRVFPPSPPPSRPAPTTVAETAPQCPRCRSTHLSAYQGGFSAGKAVAGAVLLGPLGLVAGALGRNDVHLGCVSCGHHWDPKNLGIIDSIAIANPPAAAAEKTTTTKAVRFGAGGCLLMCLAFLVVTALLVSIMRH